MKVLSGGGVDLDVAAVLPGGEGVVPPWQRLDQVLGDVRASRREREGCEKREREHQTIHRHRHRTDHLTRTVAVLGLCYEFTLVISRGAVCMGQH